MTREELLKIAKPVLFNTKMVFSILENIKGCTRRVIKPQPTYSPHDGFSWKGGAYGTDLPPTIKGAAYNFLCTARYKVGDILYVRETWMDYVGRNMYKADCDKYRIESLKLAGFNWHPSLHMPKEAARIFLKVTGVRMERLQDITIDEIRKEGLSSMAVHAGDKEIAYKEWQLLWDSTIDKKELDQYGWDANPWVWVYEFERVEVET